MNDDMIKAPWLYWKQIYRADERQPTHNYSVLALVTEGGYALPGDPYWEVCAFIEGQWMAYDEEKQGDGPVTVSHWCELPWYPDDGQSQPPRRVIEAPTTLEEALERLAYLEAQECLLQEWQDRAKDAEDRAREVEHRLEPQMERLNARIVELNTENDRLLRALGRATV